MKIKVSHLLVVLFFLIQISPSLQAKFEHRQFGSNDAVLEIYEFSSFSCVFCAQFSNEIFPEIKEKYIDTGKVKWIKIDVPFWSDLNKKAHILSYAFNNTQYLKVKNDIFDYIQDSKQNSSATEEKFIIMLKLAGADAKKIDTLSNDTEFAEWLATQASTKMEIYNVSGTPTLVIRDNKSDNSETSYLNKITGYKDQKSVSTAIEQALIDVQS